MAVREESFANPTIYDVLIDFDYDPDLRKESEPVEPEPVETKLLRQKKSTRRKAAKLAKKNAIIYQGINPTNLV